MEKLKSYYIYEAESQPNPSINITFEPMSEKRRLNPVRRTVLLAAAIALLATSALAAGAHLLSRMPGWFSEEGGNIAQIEVYAHPFSAQFRAYIDANEWMREDSWDGQFSYATFADDLEFHSMAAVSEFFEINIAQNSLMPDVSNNIYKTLVAYDPIYDNARITVFSNSKLEYDRLVSIFHNFSIDDEPGMPFNMIFGYYERYGFGVDQSAEHHYTSPTNGIEALLLPISPNSAEAIFALDNIVYTLSISGGIMLIGDDTIYNRGINTRDKAIEILKEIIDAFHR